MKTLSTILLLALAVLVLASGCNGANEVAGIQQGANPTPTRDGTPHPRQTPDPCRQFPTECD